jgi:hypothetical protein
MMAPSMDGQQDCDGVCCVRQFDVKSSGYVHLHGLEFALSERSSERWMYCSSVKRFAQTM